MCQQNKTAPALRGLSADAAGAGIKADFLGIHPEDTQHAGHSDTDKRQVNS